MRDRLIELLEAECGFSRYMTDDERRAKLADHLLAEGVIVPPYKVGQTVYILRSQTSNGKNLYLREERISHYRIFGERSFMCFESERLSVADFLWGKTVFLTREEAEKTLERREG